MKGVRVTELGDAQRAARLLLERGVVSEASVTERQWRNLRRYAEPVGEAFARIAGYRVDVGRSAVSLVRKFDRLVAAPIFRTPSGIPFDRLRYALVALALGALERAGQQTTLTELARRVRAAAERTSGLVFDPDQHTSRLALSHAVRVLEGLGALSLTDGSRESWERGGSEGEALYDIDLALCRRLFPVFFGPEEAANRLLHQDRAGLGRDPTRRARRQRLARALLERSVVYFADLEPEERAHLVRDAKAIGQDLEGLTGARIERRREGVALIAVGGGLSDMPFPGGGGARQAALLLTDRLADVLGDLAETDAPHADTESDRLLEVLVPGGRAMALRPRTTGPFVPDRELARISAEIASELAPALVRAHQGAPGAFLKDAIRVLSAHDLVRAVPGGVVLMPALGRFRSVRKKASDELAGQLGLAFG